MNILTSVVFEAMRHIGLVPGGRPVVHEISELKMKAREYEVHKNELIDYKNLIM